jgi:hypothetical protein
VSVEELAVIVEAAGVDLMRRGWDAVAAVELKELVAPEARTERLNWPPQSFIGSILTKWAKTLESPPKIDSFIAVSGKITFGASPYSPNVTSTFWLPFTFDFTTS